MPPIKRKSSTRSFLLVYDSDEIAGSRLRDFLLVRDEITGLDKIMPNAFVLISNETISVLSDLILLHTERVGHFLIVELSNTKRNGWLPKSLWEQFRRFD